MSSGNQVTVSQREFDRYAESSDRQFTEIKSSLSKVIDKMDNISENLAVTQTQITEVRASLSSVITKVNQINEEKVPSLESEMRSLSTRQKLMVGALGVAGGGVGSGLISLLRAVFADL